jgi:hypothetical protein
VRLRLASASALLFLLSGCSHVTTVRVQEEAIEVGPGLRPLAAVQASATSAYLLFIPIPGVDLDRVINRMLVVTAKIIGADKIANLQFEVTPDGGVWALRKLIGWRSARASGIAVQVTGPAADPDADQGPEPGEREPGEAQPDAGGAPEPSPPPPGEAASSPRTEQR